MNYLSRVSLGTELPPDLLSRAAGGGAGGEGGRAPGEDLLEVTGGSVPPTHPAPVHQLTRAHLEVTANTLTPPGYTDGQGP